MQWQREQKNTIPQWSRTPKCDPFPPDVFGIAFWRSTPLGNRVLWLALPLQSVLRFLIGRTVACTFINDFPHRSTVAAHSARATAAASLPPSIGFTGWEPTGGRCVLSECRSALVQKGPERAGLPNDDGKCPFCLWLLRTVRRGRSIFSPFFSSVSDFPGHFVLSRECRHLG